MITDLPCMNGITVKVPLAIHFTVCNVVSALRVALMTHYTNQVPQILLTDATSPVCVKSGQDLVVPATNI